MSFKPSEIKREHVLKGIEELKKSTKKLTNGTRWEVFIDNVPYPPKEVMRFARMQYDGSDYWPRGGGWPTNEFLEKMGFEVKEKNNNPILTLIANYKKHIQETQLKDEEYKWQLIKEYAGMPDTNAVDFYQEIKSIKYSNLVYAMGIAVLHHLLREKPEEIRAAFKILFDESTDLAERIAYFNSETLKIYRGLGETLQHHQDERSISTYLTFHNPEKYTFYKSSFYKSFCQLIGIKEAKKNEKYVHYLELIDDLIENYIKPDHELIDLVKSAIPQYYNGENNLILAQDILYQMLDKKEAETAINVKSEFIDWMAANVSGGNYFERQFGSNRDRFEKEINEYEVKYKENFNSELFIISNANFGINIETIRTNLYNTSTPFSEYSNNLASGRPKAILGKNNYLRFLNETFSNLKSMNNSTEPNKYPLNQILYGPPGTGKTFTTKELAVSIINADFIKNLAENLSEEDRRKAIIGEYDRLFELGQIVFTTFHQSMSYEDFVEGIKPIAPTSENSTINYKVESGIFKSLCKTASEVKSSSNFEEAYSLFVNDVIESGTIELTSLIQKRPFNVRINSNETAVAIPKTEVATEMSITKEMIREYVVNGVIKDWKTYTTAIGEYFKSKYNISVENSDNTKTNYVLIIDEINRGNVSSIFGELITLLEEDKRIGEKEQILLELPYSKNEKFGVPKNVYIIGTMNTADRSVEALDTALRRRFSFTEVLPDSSLLEAKSINGINLKKLLDTINNRIEILLNRDHTVGHSYFIKLANDDEKGLRSTFKNNIIPLLQEYFYGDYEKIGMVLGAGFVSLSDKNLVSFPKFIKNNDYNTSRYELIPIDDNFDIINALGQLWE
jgi:5-methylcytosine-specific restriction enzyme B